MFRCYRAAVIGFWAAFALVGQVESSVAGEDPDATAQAALDVLTSRVAGFRVRDLPATAGETVLSAGDALTIERLRGVRIDDAPPALRGATPAYDRRMADDCPAQARPYVARGIEPFRFRHFHCEFNYGGWHNFNMHDYAVTHGFDIVFPYGRKPAQMDHWPAGTRILGWGGFIDWHRWLPDHGIPEGRYDRLVGMDLVRQHVDAGLFRREAPGPASRPGDLLMIDMEHPVLSPDRLREQPWYPQRALPGERAVFEKKYYDGYAQTYISSVRAAREQGWKNLSIYGWYPYGRTWGGLERVEADPGTDQAWNSFGRQVYEAIDIVNNSVYCFYWTPQNVAYVLANIDMNMKMVGSTGKPKPMRPYFWTLLHGGGSGWRWWREQPLPNEEQRAMIAMTFFTGVDGLDCWNWSGTGSHHTVALRHRERPKAQATPQAGEWVFHDVMVGRDFARQADHGTPESFRRYDVLHVTAVDEPSGAVRFQKVRPKAKNCGVGDGYPRFVMPQADLMPLLRPQSEPVAAMIEGLALVRPLESILRHGTVKIDVPAQEQFAKKLPVVRRVKLGRVHVLVTYDPDVLHGRPAREIELSNFDGIAGRTLRLPADRETRIFVLRQTAAP
jgi:hypothetical protein